MQNIKDLMTDYDIGKKEGRSLPEWQVWSLDFCKKFGIDRQNYGRVMGVAKQYEDKVDYLRYIEGWLSDYPNVRGGILKLFFWKIADDKKKGEMKEEEGSELVYM